MNRYLNAARETIWQSNRRGHESMMTGVARRASELPGSRLKAYMDRELRSFRKQLRLRIAADYRLSSVLHRQASAPWKAVICAAAALRWTPNSQASFKALVDAASSLTQKERTDPAGK